MKKRALLTLAASLVSVGSFAQTAASPAPAVSTPAYPPALATAMRGGLKVEKTFPAISGLTGYVLNRDGEYTVVFATPDNQTIINGALIGPDGKNLTPMYTEQHVPKPDYDGMWPSLEKAPVVITGAKGSQVKAVIYAFLDPNCIFCHLAWKAFKPYEKAGLQVRWLPVAFLNATSAPKAAAIMQSDDPTAALDRHETNYKTGGIDPQGVAVKDDTRAKLESNSKLMKAFGFNGTPALVYKDPRTGKVLTKNGMPRLSELPGMFNLPAIPNNDEELARFQ